METNSGSSHPYAGPAPVLLERYRHFGSAGLRGGKKHSEIFQGNKAKQDRKTTALSFPQFTSLSVSLPSFLAPRGLLGPAGGPAQPCLFQPR